ncbi:MAG: NRDE family protein [Planctomycetota bacterium]
MCTVLISFGQFAELPLFLAANRDEMFDRPSEPPRKRSAGAGHWIGPRDLRAGGTWVGVNDHGLIAVITNRSDLGPGAHSTPPRSRGQLVRGVLEQTTVEAAVDRVQADSAEPSEPFNLAFGTVDALWIARRDHEAFALESAAPGLHLLSNFGRPNDRTVAEVERGHREWNEKSLTAAAVWSRAPEILAVGPGASGEAGLTKHHEGRGTVSSSVIGIASDGSVRYLHADGPPDRTPFREIPTFTLPAPPLDGSR